MRPQDGVLSSAMRGAPAVEFVWGNARRRAAGAAHGCPEENHIPSRKRMPPSGWGVCRPIENAARARTPCQPPSTRRDSQAQRWQHPPRGLQ
eukprot:5230915-Pyramimonas_sp.AAC.1